MRILAYPRIHVGLADMGHASLRAFGGVGFSIQYCPTLFRFERSDEVELLGTETLDAAAQHDLAVIADGLHRSRGGFRATIESHARQHIGLGSKTSMILSLIAGANEFNKLGLNTVEMQKLSGRGAASGVGIHTFFKGGIVWDGGHKIPAAEPLLPSSSRDVADPPPLMARLDFPPEWEVALLVSNEATIAGEEEAQFFRENAPIVQSDALLTMATLYHGVLPAFALKDYAALAASLRQLHAVGFKMRELERCSRKTRECYAWLSEAGLATGLSSMGPLLYVVVTRDDPSSLARVHTSCRKSGVEFLGTAGGWNAGYQLS